MTPRQISIIQNSFAGLRHLPDRLGARFYTRLFIMAPETRGMFKDDMVEQNRKLADTLTVVITGLNRIDAILPAIRNLAVRHRGYGVSAEHYEPVGLALIETLRDMLGLRFDGELEQAWREAYSFIATTMIDAARSAPA